MSTPYDLADLQRLDDGCRTAAASLGLEVPEVVFHFASAERIYDVAARGLPGRYSHWRFGRDYEQMKIGHDHGSSRIYELVINTEPYQAYLLEGNSRVAQLLVIAHVYGHCWFFQHNRWFERTDRKFLARVRAGAERIEDYARRHGRDRVEDFIDAVQAVSLHAPDGLRRRPASAPPSAGPADPYADLFPDERDDRRRRHEEDLEAWRSRFPQDPEEDLLAFVLAHGHRLEDWQRDVVSILREEAAYFAPQRRTKIANEGFAVWTHRRIVQGMQLDTDEFVEFGRLDAAVCQPHPLSVNPYHLGYELWSEVERIADQPTDEDRERFPWAGAMEGRERVLELASVCDDAALVAQFLTPAVAERCKLFAWQREPGARDRVRVTSREADEIRDRLARQLVHHGIPRLVITDADVLRRGALYLVHRHDGVGLDREYALGTLPAIATLWGRTVYLESIDSSAEPPRPVWFAAAPGEAALALPDRPR